MVTVSLKQILAKSPCSDGWAKVLHGRGKITKEQLEECLRDSHVLMSYSKLACDEQFPLSIIIETNSLDDCLWALRCADDIYYPLMRKFAVWSARQVQHLMRDYRSINALDVAWRHSDGLATDEELAAACDAAWAAALDAADSSAARAAAWAAVLAAAWDAADWAAAWAAAWDAAARAAQASKLKQILDAGHWIY